MLSPNPFDQSHIAATIAQFASRPGVSRLAEWIAQSPRLFRMHFAWTVQSDSTAAEVVEFINGHPGWQPNEIKRLVRTLNHADYLKGAAKRRISDRGWEELCRDGRTPEGKSYRAMIAEVWARYDTLSLKQRWKATNRAEALRRVWDEEYFGMARTEAVTIVAVEFGFSRRTVYRWLGWVALDKILDDDLAPYLSPAWLQADPEPVRH